MASVPLFYPWNIQRKELDLSWPRTGCVASTWPIELLREPAPAARYLNHHILVGYVPWEHAFPSGTIFRLVPEV